MVEGVLRLRLVADIAPGAAWATFQPAAGGDPGTTRPGRGAVGHLAALDSLRQLPGDAAGGPHLVATVRAAPWPWRRSGAPFNRW